MRKMIIDNILFTDMTKHFPMVGDIKGMTAKEDFDPTSKHKGDLFKALVHAADIGNPTRPFPLAQKYCYGIISEFFAQGDKERAMGMEISMLCDRYTTNVPKSQVGFIDFIVMPLIQGLTTIFPKLEYASIQAQKNKEDWKELIEIHEEKMTAGNPSL